MNRPEKAFLKDPKYFNLQAFGCTTSDVANNLIQIDTNGPKLPIG